MPQRLDSNYTSYSFTDEEILEAVKLTELQTAYLRTQLANAALEKLNMPYIPEDPNRYIFAQEYLRGQIDVFNLLLNAAEDSKDLAPEEVDPLNPIYKSDT